MNLAMANGFSGVGFTEMNEQEMMWIDGGDFGDFLSGVKSVCKSLVATSVGTCAAAVAAAGITALGAPVAVVVVGGLAVDFLLDHFEVGEKFADCVID